MNQAGIIVVFWLAALAVILYAFAHNWPPKPPGRHRPPRKHEK